MLKNENTLKIILPLFMTMHVRENCSTAERHGVLKGHGVLVGVVHSKSARKWVAMAAALMLPHLDIQNGTHKIPHDGMYCVMHVKVKLY